MPSDGGKSISFIFGQSGWHSEEAKHLDLLVGLIPATHKYWIILGLELTENDKAAMYLGAHSVRAEIILVARRRGWMGGSIDP